MASGLRLGEFFLLALVLLIGQILYCSADDDTNSATTESSDVTETIKEKLEDKLPECVFDDDSVSLYLYTKDYPYGVNIDENNITAAANLTTDKCVNVLILVHGFTSGGNTTEFYQISQQCIKKPDYLCLSFDWSTPACSTNSSINSGLLFYPTGVKNTKPVGEKLGKILTSLILKKYCLPWIHLACHSLGGHVCGFAGKYVAKNADRKVDAITGLDPAGPLFENRSPEDRLADTDACIVDVYHSSDYGMHKCIGHRDTFVNGGRLQPGCGLSEYCSHIFSLKLFRDCIDCSCVATPFQNHEEQCPPSYFARLEPQSSCTNGTGSCGKISLGPSCSYNATGLLGMKTPRTAPYCNSDVIDEEQCIPTNC